MYKENLISKKMRIFAERNDWLISGEYIYGEEQGYLFTGIDGKSIKSFITPVPEILDEQITQLYELLEKNSTTMMLQEYEVTDEFLCIRIKDSTSLRTDDIELILALLTGIMQDLEIVAINRCQECGQLGANNEEFIYDLYCYIHEDCVDKYKGEEATTEIENADISKENTFEQSENTVMETTDGIEREKNNVSSLKKILFTLGGAILGSIPWIILPYYMDIVDDILNKFNSPVLLNNFIQSLFTCICAFLVSYIAIVGYKLSGASMDKRGRFTVGITSIAIIIVVQFAYLFVMILKSDVDMTFNNYFTNLIKYNFYIQLILGFAIGTVFTLIAVLPFFDNKVKVEDERVNFLNKRKKTVEETQKVISSEETDTNIESEEQE